MYTYIYRHIYIQAYIYICTYIYVCSEGSISVYLYELVKHHCDVTGVMLIRLRVAIPKWLELFKSDQLVKYGNLPSGYLTLAWKWPIYRWFTYYK